MKCGLLGRKLGHSYSPMIHKHLGDYSFSLFEKEPDEIEAFLREGDFSGINVTIPYKKTVIPFCDRLSPAAEKIGAVNTIVRKDDGTLIGHNTDYSGFKAMVAKSGLDLKGKKVLILGSGGASVTAQAVLNELEAIPVVISRSGENNYGNLHLHKNAFAIVNTTPVGMYPDTGICPVDLDLFPELKAVLDVIYNPARTKLLLEAQKRGLVTVNGLWMLVAQAKESAQWFTEKVIDDAIIQTAYTDIKRKSENIVLIGMPGSGKSTVGKLLADRLGKPFVDADTAIEKAAGMSIPDILKCKGVSYFRDLEMQVLEELGKKSGLVIATGGGCVTRKENYDSLKQNGIVIWLQRELSLLPTEGRPLSQTTDLDQMYLERKPLYTEFCDYCIDNNSTAEEAVSQILSILSKEVLL